MPTGELSRGTLSSSTPDETWKLIWQGSFSGAVNKSKQNRNGFFRNLLQAQVEHEAIQTGIRNLANFQKFLTVLASRIGQEFQLNTVAAEASVAAQIAKQWLSVAESAGVISPLQAFPGKRSSSAQNFSLPTQALPPGYAKFRPPKL